jgi:hypothetical protein
MNLETAGIVLTVDRAVLQARACLHHRHSGEHGAGYE